MKSHWVRGTPLTVAYPLGWCNSSRRGSRSVVCRSGQSWSLITASRRAGVAKIRRTKGGGLGLTLAACIGIPFARTIPCTAFVGSRLDWSLGYAPLRDD